MRKQRLHAIILFVLFMMLCACAAAEGRVVRVAFLEQEGMSFIGHTGKITGYNFDYLKKISEYTGWQIEYVTYPTADYNEVVGQAIEDLRAGRVDLFGPMLKTSQSQDAFEFPENSYGTVYTTLCAPGDEPPARDEHPEREAAARRPVAAGDDPKQRGRPLSGSGKHRV